MKRRTLLIVSLVACCYFGNGCNRAAWRERFQFPRAHGAEPIEYQRAQAEEFDPYPKRDLGNPDIESRPREFGTSDPQPKRGRWLPFQWGNNQQQPQQPAGVDL